MDPLEIQTVIDALKTRSGASLETFFGSVGLRDAYRRPTEGYGKEKRINEALAEAEAKGTFDETLRAAKERFGIGTGAGSESGPREPLDALRQLAQDAADLEVADIDSAERVLARARMVVEQLFGKGNYWAHLSNIHFRISTTRERLDRVRGEELWLESRRQLSTILATAVEQVELFGLPGKEPQTTLSAKTPESVDRRKVFVVHGRDSEARTAMFEFLRALDLHPIEWEEARGLTGKPAPYVGEILNAAFRSAQAVIVLLTPDDEARLLDAYRLPGDPPEEATLTPQARPNVLFEAGMAMGTSADRTILVQIGQVKKFSDVGGIHIVLFDGTTEKRQALAQRLVDAGCEVGLIGTTDWHTAGDFPSR